VLSALVEVAKRQLWYCSWLSTTPEMSSRNVTDLPSVQAEVPALRKCSRGTASRGADMTQRFYSRRMTSLQRHRTTRADIRPLKIWSAVATVQTLQPGKPRHAMMLQLVTDRL
jgi:hypothetical protein